MIQSGAWQNGWYVDHQTLSFTIRSVRSPDFTTPYTSSLFSDLRLWHPLCEPLNLFTIISVRLPGFVLLSLFRILLPLASSRVWYNSLLSGVTSWLVFYHLIAIHCFLLVCLYLDDEMNPHVGMNGQWFLCASRTASNPLSVAFKAHGLVTWSCKSTLNLYFLVYTVQLSTFSAA